MVQAGVYRYADMTALAWRALKDNPELAGRLRARFPLVLLDEAQDTHGEQLRLLEHVFKRAGTAFQRLGRSEEHTSELQSLMRSSYAVFCLKKKNAKNNKRTASKKTH